MVPLKIAVLNYLLIIMAVLSVVNLVFNHLTIRLRVIAITSLVILTNCLALLIFNYNNDWFNLAFIPFCAIFGPLFYAHVNVFNNSPTRFKDQFFHYLLPLSFLLVYAVILFLVENEGNRMQIFFVLHFLEGICMFSYGVLIMVMKHHEINLKLRNIFVMNAFLMIIVSVSLIIETPRSIQLGASIERLNYRQISFLILFGAFGWSYFLSCFFVMSSGINFISANPVTAEPDEGKQKNTTAEIKTIEESVPYSKSRISDEKLDNYLSKLNELVAERTIYTDQEITLEKFAKELKIPASHLTQLLNIRMGINFYTYINSMRAEYARSIIRNGNHNVYDVYIRSGFSNRVSFNRYFKKTTSFTPSEYVKSLKKSTLKTEI